MELTKSTRSYNNSGVFLHNFVINELNQRGWNVDSEYPVVVAPFRKNPKRLAIRIHGETRVSPENFVSAIQDSINSFERSERSIDVVAQKKLSEKKLLSFCIECKKLNPKFTEWCFFQHASNSHKHLITKSISEPGHTLLFDIPGSVLQNNQVYLSINMGYNEKFLDFKVVDYGLALSSETIHNEFFKTEQTVIDQACRQIIEGIYGYTIDRLSAQLLHGEANEYQTTEIFIPIILTNTKLKICTFDEKQIDPKTGHILSEPKYEEVDSLIYEYNSPKSVQYPEPIYTHLPIEHRRAVSKWYVLIMSPNGFVTYLDYIQNQI